MAKPHLNRDYQRKHRASLKAAMKAAADANECPACHRKAALRRQEWAGFIIWTCRWCSYEDARDLFSRT